MILEDVISESTLENGREALSVVLANIKVHFDYYDSFPKDSVLLGDNWYFLTHIDYKIHKPPCGSTLLSDFSVSVVSNDQFRRNLPIPEVLERIKKYAKEEEMALLLFSGGRVDEAYRLWSDKDRRNGWYIVNEDDKKISVFPHARITYERNPVQVDFRAMNR